MYFPYVYELSFKKNATQYRLIYFECSVHSQYPFHEDAHKRDTKNLIHVVLNTLDAQEHTCKGPKEGFPKRASVASLFGESLTLGGEMTSRSGNGLNNYI